MTHGYEFFEYDYLDLFDILDWGDIDESEVMDNIVDDWGEIDYDDIIGW